MLRSQGRHLDRQRGREGGTYTDREGDRLRRQTYKADKQTDSQRRQTSRQRGRNEYGERRQAVS